MEFFCILVSPNQKFMKVWLVNMDVAYADKEKNIDRIRHHLDAVKKIDPDVDTIIFPELSCTGYILDDLAYTLSEATDGPLATRISELSKSYGVNIVFWFIESESDWRIYNAVWVVDKKWVRLWTYRKNHLYTESTEPELYTPGESLHIVTLDWWKIGIAVCFDIRFPELFRTYADAGVEAVFIPANWTEWPNKYEMLRSYTQARAWENQIFCAAVDRIWSDSIFGYTGSHILSNPIGEDVSQEHNWIYHIWSMTKIDLQEVRKIMPLNSSRKEKYIVN